MKQSRRLVVLGGAGVLMGGASPDFGWRPTFRMGIGDSLSEIARKSDLGGATDSFVQAFRIGGLVSTPHHIEYADGRIARRFADCASHASMPSSFLFEDDLLVVASASVVSDYVTLDTVLSGAEALMAELKGQGLRLADSPYALYAPIGGSYQGPPPNSIQELRRQLVSPENDISEAMFFILSNGVVEVSLRITNMRRKFSNPVGATSFSSGRDVESEGRDRVYYSEIAFKRA